MTQQHFIKEQAIRALLLLALLIPLQEVAAQSAGDAKVCLYSGANFTGNEFCTSSSVSFVPLRFSTASIRVSRGLKVTLYRLPFYLGTTAEALSDKPRFLELSNSVRSIRITEDISVRATSASIAPIISLLLSDIVDPNDLDGDGFSNELEEQYGTDPNDPSSTPPDLDGDKIPDDIDPDRDGDGVNNDVEEARDTDPDNAQDYPDLVPPLLVVNNSLSIRTTAAELIITGNVSDVVQPYSGIAQFHILSDQFIDTSFTGSLNEETGEFSIEVPLAVATNSLTIEATDKSGNQSSVQVVAVRNTLPTFEGINPSSGTVSTEARITLTGKIRTSLPSDQFTFTVNDAAVIASSTSDASIYEFEFADVPLVLGNNQFRFNVTSYIGGDIETIQITYLPEAEDELDAPTISNISPANGVFLNQESFRVAAQIESYAGPLTVTLDGEEILGANAEREFYAVNELVSFEANQAERSIEIRATDSLGQLTTESVTYRRDASRPTLQFDQAFQSVPAVNTVDSGYVRFSGVVSDENLASLLVNNQSISLQPGTSTGSYQFDVSLPLAGNDAVPINFIASDRSGNQTAIAFSVINNSLSSITALLPPEDTTFIASDDPLIVQVVARLSESATTDTAYVYLESAGSGSALPLQVTGSLASADIQLPNTSGSQTIMVELRNQSGQRITGDQNTVNITRAEDVPIEVVRIEPANNAQFIEPNAPIEVYFNQAVDLANLNITVRETLNGKTYVNADPLGEDFIRAQGYVLSDINRNLDVVPGQISAIPGDAGVVFNASRHYGFNADVFVEVTHLDESLVRSRFKVRELPTFINGGVADQFGQPLRGVKVRIPSLERSTVTNGDGGFAFGYQETGEQVIPSGSYNIVVNEDFANPNFGTINTLINIQRNQINTLPRYTLQELDRSISFYNLSSGAMNNLLGGDLEIDLSNARAIFPNSRTSGPIHAQFLPFEHLGVNTYQFSIPHWLYGMQPKGVKVEGDVKLEFTLPKLRGSYDYIDPDNYQYVVLLGYTEQGKVVEPVGVGKIENLQVVSVGKVHLSTLDYLGYAVVLPTLTEDLAKYANGQSSLQQLKAALQTQGQ